MIKQYEILNKCLKELGSSRAQSIGKLKLEVQLILTKRILLDSAVEVRVAGDAGSEQEFWGLYDQVRRVCSSNFTASLTDTLIARLEKVREALKHDAVANDRNQSPYRKVKGILSVLAGKASTCRNVHY